MIKNLSKVEYYKTKNIPFAKPLKRLQPEPPVRTHILDIVPSITMEVQKIIENHNQRGQGEDKVILEYADCRRIVHSLENQVEALQQSNQELISQIELFQSQKTDFQRKINEYQTRFLTEQSTSQRIQFEYKIIIQKLQNELFKCKDDCLKKVAQLEGQISHIQNLRKKQISQISNAKWKILSENEKLIFQNQIANQNNTARVQSLIFQIQKQKQQKQKLMEELLKIQSKCQIKVREIQGQNFELRQALNKVKSEKQYLSLMKDSQIDRINRKVSDIQVDLQNQMRKSQRDRKNWQSQKMDLQNEKKQVEESWKSMFEGQTKSKQDLNRRYAQTYSNLKAAQRQIQDLSNLIKDQERIIRGFSVQEDEIRTKYDAKVKEEESNRKKQSEIISKLQIQIRTLSQENQKNCEINSNLRRELSETHDLLQRRIRQKQIDQARIKSLEGKLKKYETNSRQRNQEDNKLHDQIKILSLRVRDLQREIEEYNQKYLKEKQMLSRKYEEQLSRFEGKINQEMLSKSKNFQIHQSQLRCYYENELKQMSRQLQNSKKDALSFQNQNSRILSENQRQLQASHQQIERFNEKVYRMNMRIKDLQQEILLKNVLITELESRINYLSQSQNQWKITAEKLGRNLKKMEEQKRQTERHSQDLMSQSKSRQYEVISLEMELARQKTIILNKTEVYEKNMEQIYRKLKEKERQVIQVKQQALRKHESYSKNEISSKKMIEEMKESIITTFKRQLQEKEQSLEQLKRIYLKKQDQLRSFFFEFTMKTEQCQRLKQKQIEYSQKLCQKDRQIESQAFSIRNLNQKLAFYEKSLKERQTILDSETKRIKMLEKQVSQSVQKKQQISEGLKRLAKDYECILSQRNALDSVTKEKDLKIFALVCQITQIKDEMQSSVSQKSRTEKKLKNQVQQMQNSLNSTVQRKDKLQEKVSALECLIYQKQQTNSKLNEQNKNLKQELALKQSQRSGLVQQIKSWKCKQNQSQNCFKQELEMIEKDLKDYQEERSKLIQQIQRNSRERQLIAKNIDQINARMQQLIQSEAAAKDQLQKWKNEVFRLQKIVEKLEHQKILISSEKSDIWNTNLSLSRKVTFLEQKIFGFDRQIENLNHKYQKQKRECDDLTMRYAKIKQDYQKFTQINKQNYQKESRRLRDQYKKREQDYKDEIERLKIVKYEHAVLKKHYENLQSQFQAYRDKMQEKRKHWQFVFDQSKIFDKEMKREQQDLFVQGANAVRAQFIINEKNDRHEKHERYQTNERYQTHERYQSHELYERHGSQNREKIDLRRKIKVQEIDSISKFILYSGSSSNKEDQSEAESRQEVLLQYSQEYRKMPMKKASKTDSLNLLADFQSKAVEVSDSLDESQYIKSSINHLSMIQPFDKENRNNMNAEFDAQNFERKVKTVEEAEFYELMDGSSPPEF